MLLELRGQSDRFLAASFAQQAEEALVRRAQSEQGAAKLEELARVLRRNASELVASAPRAVADAALRVVGEVSQRSVKDARDLDASAQDAEVQANQARSEALQATERARSAQASAVAA